MKQLASIDALRSYLDSYHASTQAHNLKLTTANRQHVAIRLFGHTAFYCNWEARPAVSASVQATLANAGFTPVAITHFTRGLSPLRTFGQFSASRFTNSSWETAFSKIETAQAQLAQARPTFFAALLRVGRKMVGLSPTSTTKRPPSVG